MRFHFLVLPLLLPIGLSLVATTAAAAPSPPDPAGSNTVSGLTEANQRLPDLAERAYIAARLYQAVVTYFAHDEALPDGYDFQNNFRVFLREAVAAQSRLAFSKAAMRLMGSLRNGHTSFTDKLLSAEPPLPFRALRLDGKWIVSRSKLSAGTLDPGDEIETLDNKPIDDWIADNIVFTRRSNQTESETVLFADGFLWPARFVLGLQDGRTVSIDRTKPAAAAWRGVASPEALVVDEPRPGVVRIRIPGFDKPEYENAALDAVRAHPGARAILLDVRGNGGGNTPQRLLAALVEHPYRNMVDSTPLHIGTLDAWAQYGESVFSNAMVRSGGEIVQPDHPIYHGRVLLLTDRSCASACEDLAVALHQSGRATILGETTFGSTGQPFTVDFPEAGMELRVGARREYLPDLKPFEGIGVIPDIAVATTRAALQSGDDPVLRRALDLVPNP